MSKALDFLHQMSVDQINLDAENKRLQSIIWHFYTHSTKEALVTLPPEHHETLQGIYRKLTTGDCAPKITDDGSEPQPLHPFAFAEGHNPDKLTNEQVGVSDGWRLLEEDEIKKNSEYPAMDGWINARRQWDDSGYYGATHHMTYRTKLSKSELAEKREEVARE